MKLETNPPADSTAVTDNKSLNLDCLTNIYSDKNIFLHPFNGDQKGNDKTNALLPAVTLIDEKSTGNDKSSTPAHDRTGEASGLLSVSTSVTNNADIWGKDHLISMGELTTKMKAEGVSKQDFDKLDKLEKEFDHLPANQRWKVAEEIGDMAKQWNKGAHVGALSLEEMARLYIEFDKVARLDGDGNTVSAQDLKILDQAVTHETAQAVAEAGPGPDKHQRPHASGPAGPSDIPPPPNPNPEPTTKFVPSQKAVRETTSDAVRDSHHQSPLAPPVPG
jgi:hypothetical protein